MTSARLEADAEDRRASDDLSWHPALEQWDATQFQNRFRRLANRPMRPLDYDVWVAVRSIGEAAVHLVHRYAGALGSCRAQCHLHENPHGNVDLDRLMTG